MKIKENSTKSIKRTQSRFLFLFLLFPTVQFLVFYVGVNFNSIVLSFQKVEAGNLIFAGFDNYADVLADIFVNGRLSLAIKNSFIQFFVSFILGTPIHIMIAYAIFRKIPLSNYFKVIMFLPSMISSMVFVICGRYLIVKGFPVIFGEGASGLLRPHMPVSFYTVLWFGYWMNFSSGMIIYLGAMGSISKDVLEYDKLEPISSLRELWSIIIPLIYPTITTYVVAAISGFFVNYGYFYSFFEVTPGETPPYETLGFVFFVKVSNPQAKASDFPYASAGGLLFSAVLAPVTLAVKWLLEKFGPSEE